MRSTPSYLLHKATGQARVVINDKTHYLGQHGTKESHNRYDRLIQEWLASGRSGAFGGVEKLTIVELLAEYCEYAGRYYGTGPKGELKNVLHAIKQLRDLYGTLPASEFGPAEFKTVREQMVKADLSRGVINDRMKRICRIFRWAATEAMLQASVYETLRLIPGLKRGRTAAREAPPVLPVDEALVSATCKHLPPVLADMVRCQLLIGCRPGEICKLTPKMIDRTGEVWVAELGEHKTAHHGHTRHLYIGPQAQLIITPYLLRDENEHLFRPCDSEHKRRSKLSAERVTPLNQGNRAGYNQRTRKQLERLSKPGDCYTTISYRQAVGRAALKANPIPKGSSKEVAKAWRAKYTWSPNQLRHTRGTIVRRQFGLEGAQVILGHAAADVTQIYAERDSEKAIAIQLKTG